MSNDPDNSGGPKNIWAHIGHIVEKRAGMIVIITLLITGLLVVPWQFMGSDRQASSNPEDEVFDLKETLEDRMPLADIHTPFILESRDGDALTQEVLLELYQNEEKLRGSDLGMGNLTSRYDVETNRWTVGIFTIADAVDQFLLPFGGLERSSDSMVKLAIHHILSNPEGEGFRDWFSQGAYHENGTISGQDVTIWFSPAIIIHTNSDSEKVQDGYRSTLPEISREYEDYEVLEYYNRDLQDTLRGNESSYKLWGIAIDVTLEANDEAKFSMILIFFAIVLILIIVAVIFRSFNVFLLTAAGLLMIIIWMWGLSNLVGLNSSLTIKILIPVSILVLGVDYMIHAVHRYEEERAKVGEPRRSIGLSTAGVGGALFIAMITTVVAFGSNAISEIEEIVGFGVAASLAIVSAFWIMGFFLPSAKMLLDSCSYLKKEGKAREKKNGKGSAFLGKLVLGVAKKRLIVLPIVLMISIGAGFFATQLEAKLDVKEYFDPSSDFVVSLDKLEEHIGDKGGEKVTFYIEGDLTDPEVWEAIIEMEDNFNDNENIAKDTYTNEVLIYRDMLNRFDRMFSNNYTIGVIEVTNPGLNITDEDGNRVPDTPEQLRTILHFMYEFGLPNNATTYIYDPAQMKEVLWIDPDNEDRYATIVMMGIPDTRELATVKEAEQEFREDMKSLEVDGISRTGLTGSAIERERTLTAITDSLSFSIIVAIVLCFIALVVILRSFKYAIVTVVPELLVVACLYAFMFLAGFHLNAVTATIAAISIGVGIDYSVHMTARFREELERIGNREEALKHAAKHSGVALLGSAVSTMVGFAIIGFAPMPMFSSFGILTALMIIMAFVAALFVLPSLLMLVSRSRTHN
ncbi:MAG: MMPL family transporter [Candidatus Thermoplasmatota archaeon]|nr:MMPL family transporter [Candidatus Thermoplasmatota archaeon]